VTGVTDEIWQAIEPAESLPHGRAKIVRLEQLAAHADDLGDAKLGTAVRVCLIPACLYGGEHQRVSSLLSWLLERYDEAPAWFGPWERHNVLFSFTWATVGLLEHPDVSLSQLRRNLATMAERYAAAGESPAPVLRAEFLITLQVSGPQQAQPVFDAWVAAPRSPLSDCADCERTEQVRQLAALDRHAEAVALAMPVLDGALGTDCEAQPAAVIAAALGSLLATGQGERAAGEHIRAVRLLRDLDDGAVSSRAGRADHLLVCGRSGRLQRGLELIESWLPWYARVGPPAIRLETAAAAGRVLRGLAEVGHGRLGLIAAEDTAEPTHVDELGARLAREARDLGARFDARNDTSTVGDLVERMLGAPALPDLPLDSLTRSPHGARVRRPAARARRGRRADGSARPAAPNGDLNILAEAFDSTLGTDVHSDYSAILDTWRELRGMPFGPGQEQAAARLDSWLAIEELSRPGLDEPVHQQNALAAAALATERLRAAGLITEAQLHEQSFLLAAAQAQRIDLRTAAERIEQLTTEVGRTAGPADTGLALSRLVLIREIAAARGHEGVISRAEAGRADGDPGPADRDPLDAGLAALESVPPDELSHQHLRAICRLLRIRAADEPPEESITTLFSAVAVLPDGVRPLERALAGADLAGALHDSDPPTALTAWEQAIADAETAGATALLGNLLAASATLRHTLGEPVRAAADLARAVPLLDEHAARPLAAQARLDLARVLLDVGRLYEAAEVAEAGLADLTDLLHGQSITVDPADEDGGADGAGRTDDRPDGDSWVGSPGGRLNGSPGSGPIAAQVHLAGASAYAAAEANSAIGFPARARELARRSAAWHRFNGNLIAQAEAWQLAATLGGPPARVAADLERAAELAEAGGDWGRAATCRRERIIALKDAEGMDAALAALAAAEAALGARVNPAGRHASPQEEERASRQLRWHRLAMAEQRARMLAVSGRFGEAMAEVAGLEDEYQALGDAWSARDLKGLRGQLRAELNDLAGALDDLRQAAEEAEAAGDLEQAHGLGERLAAVLAEAGQPDQAEAAWQRFCHELSPA
jgi:tetratricopeptide (TPR) repeat protein